jgi:hypothetical protein
MFEQPGSTPEGQQRLNMRLGLWIVRVGAGVAVAYFTRQWWPVLAVPIGLLLIFGPVIVGQRLGRRPPEKE